MPETATADEVTPVRDLDSAAAYFDKIDNDKGPASDSTATPTAASAATGAIDPENPDDPNNPANPDNPNPDDPDDKGKTKEEDDGLTPEQKKELPDWAHKRMGEISAKKNELQTEVGTLKEQVTAKDTELEDLRKQVAGRAPTVVAPTPENPLANVEDPAALQRELDQSLNFVEWCEMHPDGGTVKIRDEDGKIVEQEKSAEEVRAAKANANRMINQHIPARMKFLEGREQYVAKAREEYPELFKTGTQDHSDFQALLSHWPELKRFLDPEIIAGRYLRGLKVEQAEKADKAKKAKGEPAEPVKKPATAIAPTAPRQPSAAAMPSGDVRNDAAKAEAKKQANKAGTVDAAARYFDA